MPELEERERQTERNKLEHIHTGRERDINIDRERNNQAETEIDKEGQRQTGRNERYGERCTEK